MANNIYGAVLLTGNVDGSLDSVDGNILLDGDCGIVVTATNSYTYKLNATSGATASSPNIIAPAVNPGTKRWILVPTLPSRLTKTASYTLVQGDGAIFANTTSGNITITLPPATVNEIFRIVKTVAANSLIIQRAGADTIEGQPSITLTGQYLSTQLYSDGVSTWYNV